MSKKAHSFTAKLLNWFYCTKCGLLTLKNEATLRAMRKPCTGAEEED